MSKIIVDLKSIKNINNYVCDGFVLNSKEYSCFNDKTYSYNAIRNIIKIIRKNNDKKEIYLNIDKIILESELIELYAYLNKLYEFIDFFIFSDLSIFNFFLEKSMVSKLIYNPKTLIASSYELSFYQRNGVKCFLSNELSSEELKEISNNVYCYEAFGYHQIFYSKRPLISLFNNYKNNQLSIKKTKGKFFLKEETRDDLYLIYESQEGTFIYTPFIYCAIDEIKNYLDKIDTIYINSIFISEEKVLEILKVFNEMINQNEETYFHKIESIVNNLSRGFLDKKSILLKDNKNE